MSDALTATEVARSVSRQHLRIALLASLEELLAERPWGEITMTHIARHARVSRQTLYNEFGSRDEFIAAYVLWAAEQFLDEVEGTIAQNNATMEAALTAGLHHMLHLGQEHPLVRGLEATTGEQGLLALVAGSVGRALLDTTTARLDGIIGATWPAIPERQRELLSEVLVRLSLSHLLVPTHTPVEATERVRELLQPYLDLLTG